MITQIVLTNSNTIFSALVFVLGACFGSFAALIIFRAPKGESIVTPRSYCPSCMRKLKIIHNIPIVSWLLLRGRCGYCRGKIGIRPLFVELLFAVGFLGLYLKFGFSVAMVERCCLLFLLVCLAYIDLDTMTLPVFLLAALIALGLVANVGYLMWPSLYVGPSFLPTILNFMVFKPPIIFSIANRCLGGVVGLAVLAIINLLATMILRRTGRLNQDQWAMGFGDAILLGGIGLFVGISYLVVVIFLASALGSAVGIISRLASEPNLEDEIAQGALPYGPFLAIAAIYVYLF